jgi:phosphoserine phosphatase RsbU/P
MSSRGRASSLCPTFPLSALYEDVLKLVEGIIDFDRVVLLSARDEGEAPATLAHRAHRARGGSEFILSGTMVKQVQDRATGHIEYVNAGHNTPVLIHADGGLDRIEATRMPIGLFESSPFTTGSVTLESGAMLSVFSDGIDEAPGQEDRFYGAERVRSLLTQCTGSSAASTVRRVIEDVRTFTCGMPQSDDIVLLALRRQYA